MEESANFWKEKFEKSDKNLQELKDYAHKAVADYEDLKKKYDQNHKQYEIVRKDLEESQRQLEEVQKLVQPAYEEYRELETRVEIENRLKNEAEKYAAQVSKKCKDLTRQSQMLLDMVPPDVSMSKLEEITREEDEDDFNQQQSAIDRLNEQIQELTGKLAESVNRVVIVEENLQEAQASRDQWKEKHDREFTRATQLEESLEHHRKQFDEFNKVSVLALKDYDSLQEKYEQEKALKIEAESVASKMLRQKNIMQRQSMAAITDAAKDEKVHKAFMEIEDLEKQLEQTKMDNKTRIEELEAALESSKDAEMVETLQSRLESATEQIKDLQAQVKEITMWRDKYAKENEDLTNKLDVAEQRLRPPAPPPPPPPPPPPLPILRPLHKLINRNKAKKNEAGGSSKQGEDKPGDDNFKAAMDEMMKRIKSGATLRPAAERRLSASDARSGNMVQLHSALKKFQRSDSESSTTSRLLDRDEGSEFLKTFNKIRGTKKLGIVNENEKPEENSEETVEPAEKSPPPDE